MAAAMSVVCSAMPWRSLKAAPRSAERRHLLSIADLSRDDDRAIVLRRDLAHSDNMLRARLRRAS